MHRKKKVGEVCIGPDASVKDALKQLDRTAGKVLLVVDAGGRLMGVLSDGDVRRFMLAGGALDAKIEGVYNSTPRVVTEGQEDAARRLMIELKVSLVPVLDARGVVVDYVTLFDQVSAESARQPAPDLGLPVVIMAGGKGTRLEPFTRILPKPLIPIGEKPMLEHVIDEFRAHGATRFYITLNYKAELIESYFSSIERDYDITFVQEPEFFGTAGSLNLLPEETGDTFIVSNCDVIVRAGFAEVVRMHRAKGAALTILSSIQHYSIPYGVVQFENGGRVTGIVEKPEYTFTINTGVYVVSREALSFIPKGSRFDMPDLISALMSAGKVVFTYPVNEGEYIDIGQWKEYRKALEHFEEHWRKQ